MRFELKILILTRYCTAVQLVPFDSFFTLCSSVHEINYLTVFYHLQKNECHRNKLKTNFLNPVPDIVLLVDCSLAV